MYMHYDPDEWEVVIVSQPCTACGGALGRCNGKCSGSAGYSTVKRAPEYVAAIKAERRRFEEDAILAQAERIKASRGMTIEATP